MHVTALIVAAGPGSRLGADQPKAFVALAGAPLLVHSLRALLADRDVAAAVIVGPPGQLPRVSSILEAHGPWRCPIELVEGGRERQDSVRAGLFRLGTTDLVAIHDAARPFVGAAVLAATIACADREGAAIVATPATDTIKRADDAGLLVETLPREQLWLAQTPQIFRTALIREAHERALASGLLATDDAALVERLGVRVHPVRGNPENRKITTPDDLRWAEWLLRSGAEPR